MSKDTYIQLETIIHSLKGYEHLTTEEKVVSIHFAIADLRVLANELQLKIDPSKVTDLG